MEDANKFGEKNNFITREINIKRSVDMKQKYLILSMALFFFLILFSTTSLALIPGDFGSANNGPPDGVVDFEDLMIFAMHYGDTCEDL